jgi:hypothetical protein
VQRSKLWWVGVYAMAMAYVEAAVVIYLRRLYNIEDIARDIPSFESDIAAIEMGRELATLVMLLGIGWIAGRSLQSRLAFAFFAFGVWDIFYYFWLWVFIGWPASPLDMDLLFLLPLPWWGPVLSPMLIALLMVGGGIAGVLNDDGGYRVRLNWNDVGLLALGLVICLYVFMADAVAAMPIHPKNFHEIQPTTFKWPIYITGFVLMCIAVWRSVWQRTRQSSD